ncbi:MAG: mechanosensitive ion channel family protein [Bryobacteraceae bacterium]
MRFLDLAAALLVSLFLAEAQQIAPGSTVAPVATRVSMDPLGRDTPQSAVIGFLEACRTQNYKQAAAYLDLRALPAAERALNGPTLARQLEQLLDRNTEFDAGAISRNPEGDTGAGGREPVAAFMDEGRAYQVDLERVQLRLNYPVWQFSSSSVGLIPQLYKLVGESAFERRLPEPLVSWTLLETAVWRWLALILLATLLTALSSLLSRGLLRLVHPILRRASAHVHPEILETLAAPLRLLVVVAGFRAGMEFIGPSALLRLYLGRVLTFLFSIGVAWAAMRLVEVATDRIRFVLAADHESISSSILPLVNKMSKIVIFVLTVAVVLSNWGYNTTTVLAGVGVGGLAVALAAQKTLENLFGGVAVISDRPVLVGDTCRFGDRTGDVEDIGLRSTRIRTPDRTLVTVPNGQFSSMTLENLSRRDKIWFHPKLSLTRETSPAQIRQLLDSISRLLDSNPKVDSGSRSVHFAAVGAYSLDFDVSAYILTSDDDEFSRVQQELLLRILEAVEAAGTRLAFPTQTSINYNADAATTGTDARPTDRT